MRCSGAQNDFHVDYPFDEGFFKDELVFFLYHLIFMFTNKVFFDSLAVKNLIEDDECSSSNLSEKS